MANRVAWLTKRVKIGGQWFVRKPIVKPTGFVTEKVEHNGQSELQAMGHAISFPCASVAGQLEDRGLSKEVHSGCVLVEIREDGSERLANAAPAKASGPWHSCRPRFNRALPDAELDGFVDALARRIASFDRRAIGAAKNLVNQVSLPSADRLLDAITSFETALTWPEAQHRIQTLLKRGLQQDSDFENRWPEVLGTLVET